MEKEKTEINRIRWILYNSNSGLIRNPVGNEKSPEILILFSPINDVPEFEIPIEDYFNAMVWEFADEFIYSHRSDVSMDRLKNLAHKFEMSLVIED